MKTYELLFNEIDIISAVESPAVKSTLMAFSDEKPLRFLNDEKQIFYSVVMRPDMLIFRSDINGEPANVFYSKDTVAKMQQQYYRNKNNQKTNLQHSENSSEGIFPFESWIVENPESDKAILMGLDAKVGDWVQGYKVDCPLIWEQVKNGEINGLSIESSNYELKPIINMNTEEQTFFEKIKALFASQSTPEEEIKEPEVPAEETEDPTAELKAENEMLKTKLAELETKLTDLQAEKAQAEAEMVQMAKQTMSAQPIVNVPTVKFEDLTPLERFRLTKNQ